MNSSAQEDRPHITAVAATAALVVLYYPGHRQIVPKLRAFIEHVMGLLTE